MIRIGLCQKDNNSCEKKDTCLRFTQDFGEPMNILAVCTKDNDYKYYWKSETQEATSDNNQESQDEK